jgi:hypothetical protein
MGRRVSIDEVKSEYIINEDHSLILKSRVVIVYSEEHSRREYFDSFREASIFYDKIMYMKHFYELVK